jgi:hypothetical protein
VSEHPQDLETAATHRKDAALAAQVVEAGSELHDLEPIDRVQEIDRLTDAYREAMAILAAVRDEAIRELATASSVVDAAEALGVSRQAVYKVFQGRRNLPSSGAAVVQSSTHRMVEQIQRELAGLQERVTRETRNQASMSERLSRVLKQQARASSLLTAQSKQREAERIQRELIASQKRRADLEKKASQKAKDLNRYQGKLVKEQALERNRMLSQIQTASRDREKVALSNLTTAIGYAATEGSQAHGPKQLDVFISHATEDKAEVANPLAEELRKLGLKVWYDEFELRVGDNLRRKIDEGLVRSRFGIVVLSSAFFEKNWPQYELDGLVEKEMQDRRKVILPLWHKISKDEVMRRSPSLADKVALSTAQFTVAELAERLNEAMQGSD